MALQNEHTLESTHESLKLDKTQAHFSEDPAQNQRQVMEFERSTEEALRRADTQVLELQQRVDELTTAFLVVQAAVEANHP